MRDRPTMSLLDEKVEMLNNPESFTKQETPQEVMEKEERCNYSSSLILSMGHTLPPSLIKICILTLLNRAIMEDVSRVDKPLLAVHELAKGVDYRVRLSLWEGDSFFAFVAVSYCSSDDCGNR